MIGSGEGPRHDLGAEGSHVESAGACSCREAAERVFEWLDGELSPEETARIGAHLEMCARCHPRIRFERGFREAVARAKRDEPIPEEVRKCVLDALRARGFEPG